MGNTDNGVGGKSTYRSLYRRKMESSQLQRVAEVSHHRHLPRSPRAACSAAESPSYAVTEADDVLPDICHSAGLSAYYVPPHPANDRGTLSIAAIRRSLSACGRVSHGVYAVDLCYLHGMPNCLQ